jgi:ABC-type glutathione transport system ATPase component
MTDLLSVERVSRSYALGGMFGRGHFDAVADVSFALPGIPEILTIVGESGSGKSTLARMILGLVLPSQGRILLDGTDIATLRGRRARRAFMARVQPIFQNPFEAFSPLGKVESYLVATARNFTPARDPSSIEETCDRALKQVGLSRAEVTGRFPHELSGGQLQRVAIARALIPRPALLLADEPVSMVDASLRMSIVNLFRTLCDEHGVSIVYITHDLATAYYISDRIVVMQSGRVVEAGPARRVLGDPQHEYTRRLKEAVLSVDLPAPHDEAPRTMSS